MSEQRDLLPMAAGDRLRQARERQKRSLAECASALKVPMDVLEALEAGNLGRFAPLYRKGYVKSYALLLGLPGEHIAAMIEEVGSDEPELKPVFTVPQRSRPGDRWLRASSYVLASLLIGTLAWQLTHEAVRLSQPEDVSRTDTPLTAPSQTAEGNGHVNASIAALEDLGRTHAGHSTGLAGEAWRALQERPEPMPDPSDGLAALDLVTSGDSWVEIFDAADRQLEMDLVRAGSERSYRGEPPFRIVVGRASAVELRLDGSPVDLTPYTAGGVAQLSLDVPGPGQPR